MHDEEVKFKFRMIAEFENVKYAIWSDIMLHLSETSKERVRDKTEFEEAVKDGKNVLRLWKLIKLVHSGASSGNDKVMDRQQQRIKIEELKQ
jgi:hypothetical protein